MSDSREKSMSPVCVKRKKSPSPERKIAKLISVDSKLINDFYKSAPQKTGAFDFRQETKYEVSDSESIEEDYSMFINYKDDYNEQIKKNLIIAQIDALAEKKATDFTEKSACPIESGFKDMQIDIQSTYPPIAKTIIATPNFTVVPLMQMHTDKSHKADNIIAPDETVRKIPNTKLELVKPVCFEPLHIKYAPQSELQLIGNKQQLNKLKNWLSSYEKSAKNTKNIKAALISGPPGIGKTSCALLISSLLGYQSYQLNSSSCRNKTMINEKIRPYVTNTYIIGHKKVAKSILIMDEVDGMSVGDEGGIAALIECIRISRIPIICICNDRYCTSIKSLASHCLDIKFSKPTYIETYKFASIVCKNENILKSQPETIKKICENSDGDMRSLLNVLELAKKKSDSKFTCIFEKDFIGSISGFESASLLLGKTTRRELGLNEKVEMVLSDHDFISALIGENYIDVCDFKDLAESTEALSYSDLVMTRIKTEQEWALLPNFAHLVLLTASFSNSTQKWPEFPQSIAKSGTIAKNERLIQDFKHKIWQQTAACDIESSMDYCQVLLEKLSSECDISERAELLMSYRIDKDTIKESMIPFVTSELRTKLLQQKNFFKWIKNKSLSSKAILAADEEDSSN